MPKSRYADTLATCIDVYGDNWQALRAAYECAYISENRRLPDDALMIEAFDEVDGNLIFIHRDWKGA